MNAVEIEELVRTYIEQSQLGLDKENPKFDFKREWYNLKDGKGINEFLKDVTSIANTFGPDGFIVIGFDDKKKEFCDAKFKDCTLKDSSEIIKLIGSKVDSLFTVNTFDMNILGHDISVIHIPPSIDKPHIIKSYVTFHPDGKERNREDHKIFVRKNTSTYPATKYDIDLMYYDRKNILPDYELYSYVDGNFFVFNIIWNTYLKMDLSLSFENVGKRPISIRKIGMSIGKQDSPYKNIEFTGKMSSIIDSGKIVNAKVEFTSTNSIDFGDAKSDHQKLLFFRDNKTLIEYSNLEVQLKNGQSISSPLKMVF